MKPHSGFGLQPRVAKLPWEREVVYHPNRKAVASHREGQLDAAISLRRLYSSRLLNKASPTFLRDSDIRTRLHSQLGGISKTLGCAPILSGGVENHVHVLARFSRTITQAEWVKELKRVSNLWLKEEFGLRNFEWQGGYADFLLSESNLEQVKRYIADQEEHHRKVNFQDELRELLKRHRIEWDERYVWD